jgi:hypothetical protein
LVEVTSAAVTPKALMDDFKVALAFAISHACVVILHTTPYEIELKVNPLMRLDKVVRTFCEEHQADFGSYPEGFNPITGGLIQEENA